MKLKIFLLSALIITGCSKNNQEAPLSAPVLIEESNQSLVTERLEKAKNEYSKSLKAFTSSIEKKLAERDLLFIAFQEKANLYKNLLSSTENTADIESLNLEINTQKLQHDLVISDIKKLNDSKSELEESLKKIKSIEIKTDKFILTKITEQDLRDALLESITNYKHTAQFLTLSFKNEFSLNEVIKIEDQINELEKIEQIFVQYFKFKDVLEQSESNLTKVDFSFHSDDHTTAALTHEEKFFKALNQHIDSINTFQKDASIFLGKADLKKLNVQKQKISSDLNALDQIKVFLKEMADDRAKIRLIGYDFPKDIENISEDDLQWRSKEIYLHRLFDQRGQWFMGYHLVGPRFNAGPTDHITLSNYYYERVDKKSYIHFEKVFGDAYYRIGLYTGRYDKKIPKKNYNKYRNQAILIFDAYDLVSSYIESI
ncbi:MAG: hypothetical protein ACJAT2_001267 [Bacteriovoracaceae bacterium]|jgi:hypothetical protein